MAGYEGVFEELKGRTGTGAEVEAELCRRIARVEEAGEVVPGLTRRDWNATWALMIVCGLAPIIVYAFLLGVEA